MISTTHKEKNSLLYVHLFLLSTVLSSLFSKNYFYKFSFCSKNFLQPFFKGTYSGRIFLACIGWRVLPKLNAMVAEILLPVCLGVFQQGKEVSSPAKKGSNFPGPLLIGIPINLPYQWYQDLLLLLEVFPLTQEKMSLPICFQLLGCLSHKDSSASNAKYRHYNLHH